MSSTRAATPARSSRAPTAGSRGSSNRGLWEHPSRGEWQPGNGGLCLHTIVPWPGDPNRLLVAISAVGVWLTEDGGETWRVANDGIVLRYMPEEARAEATMNHCVHDVRRSPSRPERLFMQFHDGVYRSDDGGASWIDIGTDTALPSDFGFPIVVDPADPDSAFVIPLIGAEDRTTPGGSVKVWETRDAGASWSPRGDGLPEQHAYLTVLREAFDSAGEGKGLAALLRRDVGRRLRVGRRRRDLGNRRRAPGAGLQRADGVASGQSAA